MDKEELKQEAEESYIRRLRQANIEQDYRNDTYNDGYIDGVESREREIIELKEKLKPENCLKSLAKSGFVKFTCENGNEHDQLTKAKDIMKRLVNLSNSSRSLLGDTWHETVREAEDFLKSEEYCPDCFCEDCTKECEIKKLGLVEAEGVKKQKVFLLQRVDSYDSTIDKQFYTTDEEIAKEWDKYVKRNYWYGQAIELEEFSDKERVKDELESD